MSKAFKALSLDAKKITVNDNKKTSISEKLLNYFEYRADILNNYAEPRMMDAERATACYNDLYKKLSPNCPIPMNKQKGDKKAPAYFTSIINMLVEAVIADYEYDCDYDPRQLTTVTNGGLPLRTFARRVGGAFPSPVNPIAIWEIK